MMLLRNNGIYVFVVMLLFLVWLMKGIRVNLLLTGLVMIAIAVTPDVAIKQILNLPQLFQERVGIPLQQFSRAVAVGAPLTEEERAYSIKMMIPGRIANGMTPSPWTSLSGTAILISTISTAIPMISGKLEIPGEAEQRGLCGGLAFCHLRLLGFSCA